MRGIICPDFVYEEKAMALPLGENAGVLIGALSGRIDHANADAFNAALELLLKGCVGRSKPVVPDFAGVE